MEAKSIPNRFTTSAVLNKSDRYGEYYYHFGILPSLASLYGNNPEDIVTVVLEVIPNINLDNRDKTNNGVDYWGYYDFGSDRLMILYESYISFYVCFPGGPQAEEELGRGKCLNLKIVEVRAYGD